MTKLNIIHRSSVLPLLAPILFLLTPMVSVAQTGSLVTLAQSTFDAGDEGWMVVSIPDYGPYDKSLSLTKPTYRPTGGNPGSHVATADPGAGNFFWEAPAALLGDRSAAYGGTLQYDLTSEGGEIFDEADAVLIGAGLVLIYEVPKNPSPTWATFTAPLTEGIWKKDSLKGPAATRDELQRVLRNLTALRIRGEFRNGPETGALDNVHFVTPSASTGTELPPTNDTVAVAPKPLKTGQDYHNAASAFIKSLVDGNVADALRAVSERRRASITEKELADLRALFGKNGKADYRPLDGRTTEDGYVITYGLLSFAGGQKMVVHCVFKDNKIDYVYGR